MANAQLSHKDYAPRQLTTPPERARGASSFAKIAASHLTTLPVLPHLGRSPKYSYNRAPGNTGGQVKTWYLSRAVPPALFITACRDTLGELDLPRYF